MPLKSERKCIRTPLPRPIIGVAVKVNGVYCVVRTRLPQLSQDLVRYIWYVVSGGALFIYHSWSYQPQLNLVTFPDKTKAPMFPSGLSFRQDYGTAMH